MAGTNYNTPISEYVHISLTDENDKATSIECIGNPNLVATDSGIYTNGCICQRKDVSSGNSLYQNTGTIGSPSWELLGAGGGGTPSDPDTGIQYNNAGSFYADDKATRDPVTNETQILRSYNEEVPSNEYDITAGQILVAGNVVGTFIDGENITDTTTGATATMGHIVTGMSENYLFLTNVSGSFNNTDSIEGDTSGATADVGVVFPPLLNGDTFIISSFGGGDTGSGTITNVAGDVYTVTLDQGSTIEQYNVMLDQPEPNKVLGVLVITPVDPIERTITTGFQTRNAVGEFNGSALSWDDGADSTINMGVLDGSDFDIYTGIFITQARDDANGLENSWIGYAGGGQWAMSDADGNSSSFDGSARGVNMRFSNDDDGIANEFFVNPSGTYWKSNGKNYRLPSTTPTVNQVMTVQSVSGNTVNLDWSNGGGGGGSPSGNDGDVQIKNGSSFSSVSGSNFNYSPMTDTLTMVFQDGIQVDTSGGNHLFGSYRSSNPKNFISFQDTGRYEYTNTVISFDGPTYIPIGAPGLDDFDIGYGGFTGDDGDSWDLTIDGTLDYSGVTFYGSGLDDFTLANPLEFTGKYDDNYSVVIDTPPGNNYSGLFFQGGGLNDMTVVDPDLYAGDVNTYWTVRMEGTGVNFDDVTMNSLPVNGELMTGGTSGYQFKFISYDASGSGSVQGLDVMGAGPVAGETFAGNLSGSFTYNIGGSYSYIGDAMAWFDNATSAHYFIASTSPTTIGETGREIDVQFASATGHTVTNRWDFGIGVGAILYGLTSGWSGNFDAGVTITGVTSSATGTVVGRSADGIFVLNISGEFIGGENVSSSGGGSGQLLVFYGNPNGIVDTYKVVVNAITVSTLNPIMFADSLMPIGNGLNVKFTNVDGHTFGEHWDWSYTLTGWSRFDIPNSTSFTEGETIECATVAWSGPTQTVGSGLNDLSMYTGNYDGGPFDNTWTVTIDGVGVTDIWNVTSVSGTFNDGDLFTFTSGGTAEIVSIPNPTGGVAYFKNATGSINPGDTGTSSNGSLQLVSFVGNGDTFSYTDTRGHSGSNISINGSGANPISYSLYLNWGSAIGHTLGNAWEIQYITTQTGTGIARATNLNGFWVFLTGFTQGAFQVGDWVRGVTSHSFGQINAWGPNGDTFTNNFNGSDIATHQVVYGGTPRPVGQGVNAVWLASAGHTLGDQWTFEANEQDSRKVQINPESIFIGDIDNEFHTTGDYMVMGLSGGTTDFIANNAWQVQTGGIKPIFTITTDNIAYPNTIRIGDVNSTIGTGFRANVQVDDKRFYVDQQGDVYLDINVDDKYYSIGNKDNNSNGSYFFINDADAHAEYKTLGNTYLKMKHSTGEYGLGPVDDISLEHLLMNTSNRTVFLGAANTNDGNLRMDNTAHTIDLFTLWQQSSPAPTGFHLEGDDNVIEYHGARVEKNVRSSNFNTFNGLNLSDLVLYFSGGTGNSGAYLDSVAFPIGQVLKFADLDGIASTSTITLDAGTGNTITSSRGVAQTYVIDWDGGAVTVQLVASGKWMVMSTNYQ